MVAAHKRDAGMKGDQADVQGSRGGSEEDVRSYDALVQELCAPRGGAWYAEAAQASSPGQPDKTAASGYPSPSAAFEVMKHMGKSDFRIAAASFVAAIRAHIYATDSKLRQKALRLTKLMVDAGHAPDEGLYVPSSAALCGAALCGAALLFSSLTACARVSLGCLARDLPYPLSYPLPSFMLNSYYVCLRRYVTTSDAATALCTLLDMRKVQLPRAEPPLLRLLRLLRLLYLARGPASHRCPRCLARVGPASHSRRVALLPTGRSRAHTVLLPSGASRMSEQLRCGAA